MHLINLVVVRSKVGRKASGKRTVFHSIFGRMLVGRGSLLYRDTPTGCEYRIIKSDRAKRMERGVARRGRVEVAAL